MCNRSRLGGRRCHRRVGRFGTSTQQGSNTGKEYETCHGNKHPQFKIGIVPGLLRDRAGDLPDNHPNCYYSDSCVCSIDEG